MKLLIISMVSTCFLFSFAKLTEPKIPNIKVSYHPISTARLDTETDSILETWKTNNSCTYESNSKNRTFSYTELNESKKVVRSYSYPIVSFQTDDETNQFKLRTDAGTVNYVVWKDKRMVVIEAEDYNYIISK